jgi:ABC-type glutathione transport system ATPase component
MSASADLLLQAQNLKQVGRAAGPAASAILFEALSLHVAPGERLAVMAAPGGPAAALARAVGLLQRPVEGRIVFEGQDVTKASGGALRALRRRLQYVGGEGRRALAPRLNLENLLAEPLNVHRLGSPAERRLRAAEAAQAWGLNRYLLQLPASALSAALCQRAVLARACLLNPRLLVCEFPTQRLEPAAARPLMARLAEHCQSTGLACLLFTGDPNLAREFAGRCLRLHPNGQLRAA